MTLDELPPRRSHRDMIRYYEDIDPDAGSPEAIEVMMAEGKARRQAELEALAGYVPGHELEFGSGDARCFPSMGTDEVENWRHPEEPRVDL